MITHGKIPPMDASFYRNLEPAGWRRGGTYTRKLQQGMGIDQQTAAAILARASELLPSRTRLDMNLQGNKDIRDNLIVHLESDARVGRHFLHTFSQEEYPDADAFFREAAKHWIMLANFLKPKGPSAPSIVRIASILAESTSGTESISLESIGGDPDGSNLRSNSTFSTQSSNRRSADRLENAATVLSASDLPHKSRNSTAGVYTCKPAAVGLEALHSILEVRSSTEPRLAVAACMMDLFNTVNTPQPCDIYLDKLRTYWNQYRVSISLPVLSDDAIQFKFVWPRNGMPDREWNVFDDVSLRLAYRLWCSRDDVYEPFVLLLPNEVQDE